MLLFAAFFVLLICGYLPLAAKALIAGYYGFVGAVSYFFLQLIVFETAKFVIKLRDSDRPFSERFADKSREFFGGISIWFWVFAAANIAAHVIFYSGIKSIVVAVIITALMLLFDRIEVLKHIVVEDERKRRGLKIFLLADMLFLSLIFAIAFLL